MIGNLDSHYSRDSVIARFREGKGKDLSDIDDVIAKADKIKKFIIEQLTIEDQMDIVRDVSKGLIGRVNTKHQQNNDINTYIEGKILAAALKILRFSKSNNPDDRSYYSILSKKPLYKEIFKKSFLEYIHFSRTMDRPIIYGSIFGEGSYHKVRYAFDIETGKQAAARYGSSQTDKIEQLAKLAIHRELLDKKTPGIVDIYYINENDPTRQLLELFDGDLSDFLDHKTLTQPQIKSIVRHLAKTLQRIHELGVTPWDFKISNVLYKKEDDALKVSICDLEDAKKSGEIGSLTPEYSPIDAFNPFSHPDSAKVNSWQLGYLILQLIKKTIDVDIKPWPNSSAVSKFLSNIKKLSEESNWAEIAKRLSFDKSAVDKDSDLGSLIENSPYYKEKLSEFQKYFSDLYQRLETNDHPLISIALHLMDFDINKRWSMEEAIQALEKISDLDLEKLDINSTDNDSSSSSSEPNTIATLPYQSGPAETA